MAVTGEGEVPDPQCAQLAPAQPRGQVHVQGEPDVVGEVGTQQRPFVVLEEPDLPRFRPGGVHVGELAELARVVRAQLEPQPPVFHDRRKEAVSVADALGGSPVVELSVDPVGDVVLVDVDEREVPEGLLEVQLVGAPVAVDRVRRDLAPLDPALLVDEVPLVAGGNVCKRQHHRRRGSGHGWYPPLPPDPAVRPPVAGVLDGGAELDRKSHRTEGLAVPAAVLPPLDLHTGAAVGAYSGNPDSHRCLLSCQDRAIVSTGCRGPQSVLRRPDPRRHLTRGARSRVAAGAGIARMFPRMFPWRSKRKGLCCVSAGQRPFRCRARGGS